MVAVAEVDADPVPVEGRADIALQVRRQGETEEGVAPRRIEGQNPAAPLLAGYVHPENAAKIENSAAITVERVDKGCVISFVDNPNFRAFWTGTSKLYLNALCFGSVIEKTDPNQDDPKDGHEHEH